VGIARVANGLPTRGRCVAPSGAPTREHAQAVLRHVGRGQTGGAMRFRNGAAAAARGRRRSASGCFGSAGRGDAVYPAPPSFPVKATIRRVRARSHRPFS
jgi:hypothetical protein